jgi:hypothetical protein
LLQHPDGDGGVAHLLPVGALCLCSSFSTLDQSLVGCAHTHPVYDCMLCICLLLVLVCIIKQGYASWFCGQPSRAVAALQRLVTARSHVHFNSQRRCMTADVRGDMDGLVASTTLPCLFACSCFMFMSGLGRLLSLFWVQWLRLQAGPDPPLCAVVCGTLTTVDSSCGMLTTVDSSCGMLATVDSSCSSECGIPSGSVVHIQLL